MSGKGLFIARAPLRLVVGSLGVVLCCGMLLPQCGLRAADFVKISENGFDAEDNKTDENDYAWSMLWFQADGAKAGHLYVGTGNNIFGIADYITQTNQDGEEPTELPSRPPEIRRYTPGSDEEWEKVFDYKDVEDDELQTYGFRRMIAYRALDTGKGIKSNYLYAATQGIGASIWRSKTGDAGDWEQVHSTGPNHASIRAMAVHDGRLYLGYAYDIVNVDIPPAEIWMSEDGVEFEPVMQDGFGNENNRGIETLFSFNDWLYAGTKNDKQGYEIWKLEGPRKGADAVKVVEHGGPDSRNEAAGTSTVFNGKLYIGSLIYYGFNRREGYGFKGCDIIRIDENGDWETVVGKNSISGYDSGFNFFTNAYCWQLEEHDGWLYAGTWDDANAIAELLYNLPAAVEYLQGLQKRVTDDPPTLLTREAWLRVTKAGGDIFKTQDGVHWLPVTQDGLGNRNNYGWRTMESAPDGTFYLGSANPYDGLEIWKAAPKAEEVKQP